MSRRHSRVGSSRRRTEPLAGRGRLSRVHLVGIVPVVLGVGFFLSRALSLAAFGGSVVGLLWGLVIGLAFAVGGSVVLCVTDLADERSALGVAPREESARTTLGALAGALAVGLLAAALL